MKTNETCNPSIKCSVSSCAYHSGADDHCTLKAIHVGCTQQNVSRCDCTECSSFQLGDQGGAANGGTVRGSSCGCK